MVEIAFTQSKYGKDTKVYEMFTSLLVACKGFDPKDLWGSCVTDDSDNKVVVLASAEARIGLMYNRDKVGAPAVGELI